MTTSLPPTWDFGPTFALTGTTSNSANFHPFCPVFLSPMNLFRHCLPRRMKHSGRHDHSEPARTGRAERRAGSNSGSCQPEAMGPRYHSHFRLQLPVAGKCVWGRETKKAGQDERAPDVCCPHSKSAWSAHCSSVANQRQQLTTQETLVG